MNRQKAKICHGAIWFPVLIIFVIAIALVGVYWWSRYGSPSEKVCSQEAKLCPDGSYVGRMPPDCEFAVCPAPQGEETADWQIYRSAFFEFKHPRTWQKEGEETGLINIVSFKDEEFGYPGNGFLVFSVAFASNQAGLTLEEFWQQESEDSIYKEDSQVQIGGFEAYKLIAPNTEAGPRYIFITEEKGGYIYDIFTTALEEETINLIFSSFKLKFDSII